MRQTVEARRRREGASRAHVEERAWATLQAARERSLSLRDAAKASGAVLEAARTTRRGIEQLYLSPRDRARVAGSLTSLGSTAASLVLGSVAPPLAAVRIANSLYTLLRAGRRVRATREASIGLAQLLEEILA